MSRDVRGAHFADGAVFAPLAATEPMKNLRMAYQLADLVVAELGGLKVAAARAAAPDHMASNSVFVIDVREADATEPYQYTVSVGGRVDLTLSVCHEVVSRKRTAGAAARDVADAIAKAHQRRRHLQQVGRQHAVETPRLQKLLNDAVAGSGGALSELDFAITGHGSGGTLKLSMYLQPRFTGRVGGEEYVTLPTGDEVQFRRAVAIVLAARLQVVELDRRRAELVRAARADVAALTPTPTPAAVA